MTSNIVDVDTTFGTVSEKTISWHDPRQLASRGAELSGRSFLELIRDGALPPPPIARLLGFTLEEVGDGIVVFRCRPDESAYNPLGVVHGGLVCTLADTVVGCAVHTRLDAGVGYTSIDLNVSYLRPVHADGTTLTATGRVTKLGRRVGFATAEIVNEHHDLVATASSSLLIIDRR